MTFERGALISLVVLIVVLLIGGLTLRSSETERAQHARLEQKLVDIQKTLDEIAQRQEFHTSR